MKNRILLLTRLSCGLVTAFAMSCARQAPAPSPATSSEPAVSVQPATPDPLTLVLVPHSGESRVDKEIRRFQEQVRKTQGREAALERLGWEFVAKARESFDPGYYKLAEACASLLDADSPNTPQALLLRCHVLHNLHHFKEAEGVARELVSKRGLSFDYALLGDTLMEQGRLQEAVPAYQTMVDLRPDLHSYSRVAHVRWLKGDLEGAITVMRAAASAGSPNDANATAWVNSRLAGFELQSGDPDQARRLCETALALRPDYPPALLLRGRMQLADDNARSAVTDLERAVQQNPLPEYQWALAEALRSAGLEHQAADLEKRLRAQGASTDPRTLSLFLATRGRDPQHAVQLAEEELQQRADVFTHDALAWALLGAGRIEEAHTQMVQALAEGTEDPRLFFHAAVIAARAGLLDEAQDWFASAACLQRDDGFYADVQSVFDLAKLRAPGKDSQGGFNLHLMSLVIPISELGGDQQVVGVYATTSRRSIRVLDDKHDASEVGKWVQVARQGNPLFNEGLVAIADKDLYSRTSPSQDSVLFRKYAETPELAHLLNALVFGNTLPASIESGRTDIAGIFIPDLIKVDLSTGPCRLAGNGTQSGANPDDPGFSRLGIFGGDTLTSTVQAGFGRGTVPGGWPNGRRFGDDVVDIAVTALISDLRVSPPVIRGPAGDGVDFNDMAYNKVFPYESTPQNGRLHSHP